MLHVGKTTKIIAYIETKDAKTVAPSKLLLFFHMTPCGWL
jgi:hypothetical protein